MEINVIMSVKSSCPILKGMEKNLKSIQVLDILAYCVIAVGLFILIPKWFDNVFNIGDVVAAIIFISTIICFYSSYKTIKRMKKEVNELKEKQCINCNYKVEIVA